MNNRHFCYAFLLVVLVFVVVKPSHAEVYDAAADFSATVNDDNSTWSYRIATVRDGNYPLLDLPPGTGPGTLLAFSPGGSGLGVWNPSNTPNYGHLPYIGKNMSGVDQYYNYGPVISWPHDTLLAHPDSSEMLVLSWLSPAEMTFDVDFRVVDTDPGGQQGGISWFVELNDESTTIGSGIVSAGGDTGAMAFDDIDVVAGDRVNFIIDANGAAENDSTLLYVTINAVSAVPEPSTFAIASLALVGLAFFGWRKRK